mgnify:CR=1 FL=1
MTFRLPHCLFLLAACAAALRADTSPAKGDWDEVSVPAMKTSIYVGSVTLTTDVFKRAGDTYTTTYEAKVWPWFFWNETGTITITMPAATLEKLARGERAEFTGEAFNHKHKPRKVNGYAERADAANGKIKVRIGVDDTMIVFNGAYRFPNALK